jgi:hypothetical protein
MSVCDVWKAREHLTDRVFKVSFVVWLVHSWALSYVKLAHAGDLRFNRGVMMTAATSWALSLWSEYKWNSHTCRLTE